MKKTKSSDKGFTLIELMIVVAVIGILASVSIPKFSDMLEKSKEGATKGNIAALKSAVVIYYASNSVWPGGLTDNRFLTKYIQKIPAVKVTHSKSGYKLSGTSTAVNVVVVNATINTNTDGWKYNKVTGNIWLRNSQTDTRALSYSMYGYE